MSSTNRAQIGDVIVEDIDLDEEHITVAGPDGPARYTEADAERDSADAERRFARTRHLVPGGKSLSADGAHSPRVQTVVARETRDELERRAAAARMSVSKYIRRLIEDHLASTAR